MSLSELIKSRVTIPYQDPCHAYIQGTELEIFNYETMELIAASRVVKMEDAADQEAAKAECKQLAEKWNVRFLDSRILVLTIADDARYNPSLAIAV